MENKQKLLETAQSLAMPRINKFRVGSENTEDLAQALRAWREIPEWERKIRWLSTRNLQALEHGLRSVRKYRSKDKEALADAVVAKVRSVSQALAIKTWEVWKV